MKTKLEWALYWAAQGFAVFPCEAGGKAPATKHGFRDATTDEATIRAWWERNPDYNPAIWTKGHTVIDVDVKEGKPGLASLFDLDIDTDTLTVRTPSGGFHHFYHGESPRSTAGTALGSGLDTRSANGYVLAGGATDAAGTPYSVIRNGKVLDLPPAVFARLEAHSAKKKELSYSVEMDTEANVHQTVDFLENAFPSIEGDGGDHHAYVIACGCRDRGVSEAMALELMLEHWNETCQPPWGADELAVKVANAYAYAENSPGILSAEASFRGVHIEEPERKVRAPRKFIMAGDQVDESEDQWLLHEKFPRKGVGMIVAPSQSGKTFFALKLAECLATGERFFGTAPDEKVATLVLAAEGVFGLSRRMSAYSKLPFGALPVSGLNDAAVMRELRDDIAAFAAQMKEKHGARLGLIVLETLSASLLVEDENSNSDMAKAVKTLEAIAAHFDCLVLFTHHTPKSSTGARGAGASFDGVDVVVEIFRDGKNPVRHVECTKGRDGPTGRWGSFTLETIVLGLDSKMRERTTCTLSMGDEPRQVSEAKPPAHFESFMASFDNARADLGFGKDDPVPRDDLRAAFKDLCPQIRDVTNPFKRCLRWAEENYRVTGDGETFNDRRPAIEEC